MMQMTKQKLIAIQNNLEELDEVKLLDINYLEDLTDLFNKELEDILNYEPEQVHTMIDSYLVMNDEDLEQLFVYNKMMRETLRLKIN